MHSHRIFLKTCSARDYPRCYGNTKRAIRIAEAEYQEQYRDWIQENCQGKVVVWGYPNPDDGSCFDLFALCENEDDGLIFKLVHGV